jgi:hypothetical protein
MRSLYVLCLEGLRPDLAMAKDLEPGPRKNLDLAKCQVHCTKAPWLDTYKNYKHVDEVLIDRFPPLKKVCTNSFSTCFDSLLNFSSETSIRRTPLL